ncbi:MAG: prolyl oligopeptidase family serine peptidase [Lachnospiraceae bacterium]|nr:prolyl oligopeptidase family serine peptidase [Lachnospiraceae bacterium]
MGLKTDKVESLVLGKTMNLSVYCPDGYEKNALPVLYFLHGRTGDEQLLKQLEMNTAAEKLIKSGKIKPMIIVCPNLDNSRGINSSEIYQEINGKYGVVYKGRYEDYIVDEMITYVDQTFYTIKDRSARYIGGISSGGYTALSIGLRHPELFSKIGGHMPAVDLSYEEEDECYFADEAMWLKYDPISVATKSTFENMQVFLDDGKDDEGRFYRACEELFGILQRSGADVQYHLLEGHHNLEYVLSNLEMYLRFYNG